MASVVETELAVEIAAAAATVAVGAFQTLGGALRPNPYGSRSAAPTAMVCSALAARATEGRGTAEGAAIYARRQSLWTETWKSPLVIP